MSRDLGIPVIPTVARSNKGIPNLLNTINEVATGKLISKPHRIKNVPREINNAVDKIVKKLKEQFPKLPNSRCIALRLLEGDQRVIKALESGKLA